MKLNIIKPRLKHFLFILFILWISSLFLDRLLMLLFFYWLFSFDKFWILPNLIYLWLHIYSFVLLFFCTVPFVFSFFLNFVRKIFMVLLDFVFPTDASKHVWGFCLLIVDEPMIIQSEPTTNSWTNLLLCLLSGIQDLRTNWLYLKCFDK